MLTLRQISTVLFFCEIFRCVHSQPKVYFYSKRHLIQAGENTFACSGRSVEFRWKYNYPDHLKTVWSKQKDTELIDVASWSSGVFTLDSRAGELGFTSGRLSSNGCCGLVIKSILKEDEGLYAINVTTNDAQTPIKTGNTTLNVYEDCPDVSNSQLAISCDLVTGSKTTDFTYRDIAVLSVTIPSNPLVLRRFYYQEQQHEIVQQAIRARCYYRDDCDVVQWTMSKSSLSLAFFSKDPYLNMTVFARLYHKKALLALLNTTIRVVDPESVTGKSIPRCKAQEPFPPSGGWKSLSWSVVQLTSITLVVSNFILQITSLS